ncbi:MAG TPA: YncE family protein [Terriglobales bacterium]|jgi:YVTN family beta-propeller protein|nr:YncE family protein [Terriglobales bacterium]
MMRRKAGPVHAILFLILAALAHAQQSAPLRLEKTIPLPNIEGRIDHMAADVENQRLFVAALGNNTVEVVDIKSGKVVQTIGGLAEPQGIVYQPEKKLLWIANGEDGTVRIFDAQTWKLVRSIPLGGDADNIRRDAASQRIYVGYGSGGLAGFDAQENKVADIKLDAHPESFQLEKNGSRIFVNLPNSKKIAVIDRAKSAVIASWATDDAASNFPMALDEAEADSRLFVVCRRPAVLLVLDTKSGDVVAKLPAIGDSDDVFYDSKRKRIYASGGEGAIFVYQQQDPGHYSKIAQIGTVKGARTSLFVPELDRLFLAVRREGQNAASIQVYEVTQ